MKDLNGQVEDLAKDLVKDLVKDLGLGLKDLVAQV